MFLPDSGSLASVGAELDADFPGANYEVLAWQEKSPERTIRLVSTYATKDACSLILHHAPK